MKDRNKKYYMKEEKELFGPNGEVEKRYRRTKKEMEASFCEELSGISRDQRAFMLALAKGYSDMTLTRADEKKLAGLILAMSPKVMEQLLSRTCNVPYYLFHACNVFLRGGHAIRQRLFEYLTERACGKLKGLEEGVDSITTGGRSQTRLYVLPKEREATPDSTLTDTDIISCSVEIQKGVGDGE